MNGTNDGRSPEDTASEADDTAADGPRVPAVTRSTTPACETAAVTRTRESAQRGNRRRPAAQTARCPPAE